jgi:hypothetical protein
MVLIFGDVRIRRDITDGATTRNTYALSSLLIHKALVVKVARDTDSGSLQALFDLFDAWRAAGGYENATGDPRVLPLHMFTATYWDDLHQVQERARFAKLHGGPSSLVDTEGRPWKKSTASHGRVELWVAGNVVPAGVHWDVQAASSPSRLFSLTQTWLLSIRSYLNVNPNGTVRKGQSSAVAASLVKEVTPDPKSTAVSKARRGRPRTGRSRHR